MYQYNEVITGLFSDNFLHIHKSALIYSDSIVLKKNNLKIINFFTE